MVLLCYYLTVVEPNSNAKAVIENISYITVATVDESGQPWNTPLAVFRFDGDYCMYWASWSDNQHSQNIRTNGKAFIVIYDSTPASDKPTTGVYIQAEASELKDEQEVMQAALVFKDNTYNPSDGKEYLGDKPRRIYKAVPQHIWTNDDSEVNGDFIDVRKGAEA
ncbi:MAG: pyridoxamine 5-phosphate oxidase-like protein FMN-binding protein [Candidatus Saccharibacteria bacterium]|nr:pyridoxamine 5-phosphate oxidase-like protein FMN-binding protein [Candidatus Saccharibacteria bacterium]